MRADMMNVIDIVLLDKINKKADLINGKIPVSQLPESITEEVAVLIEADTYENLPAVGQSNVLYITTDDSTLWRWSKAKATYTHENFIKIELGIDDTYSSEVLYISTVADIKEYSVDISGEYPYVRISNALASEPYWENISVYYREAVEPEPEEPEPEEPEVPDAPEEPTEPEPETPIDPSEGEVVEEPETDEILDQTEIVDNTTSEESTSENLDIEPIIETDIEDEEATPSDPTDEFEETDDELEIQDTAIILEKSIFPKVYPASNSEVILGEVEGDWAVKNIANYGYGIQFKALEGVLYNTVPLNGNITKITLQWANDDYVSVSSNGGITVEELAEAISAVTASIPTKTSQLENDSGFITGMPEEYEQQIQETIDEAISQAFTDFVFTESDPTVPEWAKAENKPSYTAAEVGALPNTTQIPTVPTKVSEFENDAGYINAIPDEYITESELNAKGYLTEHQSLEGLAAETFVTQQLGDHNTEALAHNDIRLLIEGLTTRLNTLADSDDTTLDQLSEIVEYIKSNKELIDAITTSKISVSDIVNNLITDAADKPLSAAQGVALKRLIDAITIPTKTSQLINDSGYLTSAPVTSVNSKTGAIRLAASDVGALPDTTVIPTKVSELTNDQNYLTSYTETDPTVPAWAKQESKPSYTAVEVGALPADTAIPAKLSDLSTDDTHQTVTAAEKAKWNAFVTVSLPPLPETAMSDQTYTLRAKIQEGEATPTYWWELDTLPRLAQPVISLVEE